MIREANQNRLADKERKYKNINARYKGNSQGKDSNKSKVHFEESKDYKHLRNLLLDLGTTSY